MQETKKWETPRLEAIEVERKTEAKYLSPSEFGSFGYGS